MTLEQVSLHGQICHELLQAPILLLQRAHADELCAVYLTLLP